MVSLDSLLAVTIGSQMTLNHYPWWIHTVTKVAFLLHYTNLRVFKHVTFSLYITCDVKVRNTSLSWLHPCICCTSDLCNKHLLNWIEWNSHWQASNTKTPYSFLLITFFFFFYLNCSMTESIWWGNQSYSLIYWQTSLNAKRICKKLQHFFRI